ncbi:MAG: hypothetical protein HY606_02785 [Planctomycetes bacterium]|nr:hypothetical protein [Planctomycetota bacterium]
MNLALRALLLTTSFFSTDSLDVKILELENYWFFVINFESDSNSDGEARVELLYQDMANSRYYPLTYDVDEFTVVVTKNKFALKLHKSFKEHYALNYKVVLHLNKGRIIEKTLNLYDEEKLRHQHILSARDIHKDFTEIKEIRKLLDSTNSSQSGYKSKIDGLLEKNNMRLDIPDLYVERNAKFQIRVLLDILSALISTEITHEQAAKKKKRFNELYDEYYKTLGFYQISADEIGPIIKQMVSNLDKKSFDDLKRNLFELSLKLPDFAYEYLKDIMSELDKTSSEQINDRKIRRKIENIEELIAEMK